MLTGSTPSGADQRAAEWAAKRPAEDAISKALCVVKTRTGRWLFGGTADLEAPDLNGGSYKTRVNPQQFLFGLKLEPGMTGLKTGNLREWTYFKDKLTPAYSGVEFSEEEEKKHLVQTGDKGWYLRLRPAVTELGDSSKGWGAEFMTTSPYLFGGSVIVTTFIPRLASTSCDIGMVGIGRRLLLDDGRHHEHLVGA